MDNYSSRPTAGGLQPVASTFWKIGSPEAYNIPIKLTPLMGREEALNEIKAWIEDPKVRLVSITGPGGIGKTHLAISLAAELAESFRHQVCFISCESILTADLLPEATCLALNLPPAGGISHQVQLLNFLREKEICLIFDNLEHLLPDVVLLLAKLLEHSPAVKILATSIERLNMPGEYQYRLGGLAVPPDPQHASLEQHAALGLFAENMSKAGYRLKNADLPAAARICRLLDGIPLALLLAAGWARIMSLAEIEQAITQGVDLVGLNERSIEEKHNNIRRVFERSWTLLDPGEQRVARRLAVFKGEFDLALAERVAGANLPQLAAMVDKSFIRRSENGFIVQGFLRRYLEDQLIASNEQAEVHDCFVHAFCLLAEQAEPQLYSHEATTWLVKLEGQMNNLRAALMWGIEEGLHENLPERFEHGIRLAQALWYYWHLRYSWQEGRRWYSACLRGPIESLPPLVQVRAFVYGAIFESITGDWDAAMRLIEQGLAAAQRHNHPEGIALALLRKGGVWRIRNPRKSKPFFQESLERYQELHAPFYISLALFYLSQEHEDQPDAQTYLRECLKLSLKHGNKRYAAFSLINLGGDACFRGDYEESASCHRQAIELFTAMKDTGGMFLANCLLGVHEMNEKSFTRAAQFIASGQHIAETLGDRELIAGASVHAGFLQRAAGELDRAEEAFNRVIEINRELNVSRYDILANYGLGWTAADRNNHPTAARYYLKALDCYQHDANAVLMFDWVHIIDAYACTLVASAQVEPAAALFGSVEGIFAARGYALYPPTRESHERWLALATKKLDAAAHARAWRKGQAMDLDEAVVYALAAANQKEHAVERLPGEKYPAGLTSREVDVLRLVADGCTDAQVAEKLVLSPRTVNAHLTSIYSKLGVNSRAAATRFAIEHKLAA